MIKSKKQMFIVIGVFTLVMLLGTITYAFFNYTRTGSPNTIKVGDIYFNSSYDAVMLDGIFPIEKTAISTDTDNVMSVDVDIEGHTTYENGIYYEVKASDVNLTVNGKNIPIGISVSSNNLSNVTLTNYEDGKVLTNDSLFANGRILASDGNTDNSVDGTITIKAYLDRDRIAISDTYNGLETDLMGTTNGWVGGRVVLTTAEWDSLSTTPISFKVKVEAYENDVSTLVDGTTFIGKVKKLANPNIDDSANNWQISKSDNNITTFQRVAEEPDTSSFTDANIISTNDSVYPIYAWYDNGVIKYYTKTNNINANVDMSNMFTGLYALDNIGDLENLNTTNVINMSQMFFFCESLSTLSSIANWNVSNVIDMSFMFHDCKELVTLTPLSNWNVFNVSNMHGMFQYCRKLTSLSSLSNWNVSNVTNMGEMFSGCNVLIDISGISNWNVSNVKSMTLMFSACKEIISLSSLSNWNVSSVTEMIAMFQSCTSLSDTSAINEWNIRSVTSFGFTGMFAQVSTHPEFTKRAGTWDSNGTFTPSA